MSYCRWSSMDWQCDLYLYYSVGDFWSVNVASRRRVLPDDWPESPALPKSADETEVKAWASRYVAVHKERQSIMDELDEEPGAWLDLAEVSPKYAGFHAKISDPDELLALLEDMRREGIQFPRSVLEDLREECEAGESG